MENQSNKESLRQRLRVKYRVSVLDELTLSERWHFRLNGWGAIVWIAILFLLALALFSLLILYTPIRNYLPGYSENIRQQLIVESAPVDSMGTSLELQRQYLNVIKQVVAGEVESDTVQSLDSMQIIMREQLLEAKSEATAEFIAQYEAKEKDYLQLFDVANTTPVLSFFRPARGVVLQSFSAKEHRYEVTIQTAKHDNVTAILAGAVVYTHYELDNTYTIMLQHDSYLSIYRGVSKLLKRLGESVQAGESIALLEDKPLYFQLWQNAQPINPEEVIAF